MKKFQKEFEVHYYEVDFYQELTPLALLNFLEETAIAHSEAVGYGVTRLKEKGYGWVLSQWQIEMDQYPHYGEKVKIQTWPSHFQRFYGDREFLVLNSQDKVIARASSLWIFLNLEKRRPTRIPQEVSDAYHIFPDKALSFPFPELKMSQTREKKRSKFMIRRSDIDTNDHVNNAKYIEWVLETIPEEVYRTYRISSLEVVYKKESTYGQMIQSVTEEQQRVDQEAHYVHQILERDGEEEVALALAQTRWSKR
ncbi:acyl-[acyl-carrier-protein] thioesterase [Desulfitobacterium metallireducens]|uniref:Acyl-ACP thioesterase n=1 Tax=Desulfitobacterium metallireducens DSM 15288 TaxID=871968 RepID=W0ED98_9FIRM|nr:acyl-ACP thioesterase domain-containing protein [Desulfitobacterium metallireducens]AHF07154.1 acyl-ACP thioesterase [Desulfitobacterium metallireducens DSM 15288]